MKKILKSPYTYIGLVFIIFVIAAISNTYAWFNWQSTDDLRFEVRIGSVGPPGDFDSKKGVNKPKILDGLTPIKYDGTDWTETTIDDSEWYDYRVQTSTTESGGTSKWANAKTSNGSMFVWIPRYEYKITSWYHNSSCSWDGGAGTIEVKFIPTTQTEADLGYIIHPVFRNDPNNGGWDRELDGIWIGKFKSSNDGTGNVKIIPNVLPYTNMNVSTMFNKAQMFVVNNNSTEYDSHMMKNTEWGAVAYLAHSQYGRNGIEISMNNNNSYKTGFSGYIIGDNLNSTERMVNDVSSTSGTFPYNNTYRGVLASTTGNIYGIYDMASYTSEYTMALVNNVKSSSGFTNLPEAKYYDNYPTSYTSCSDKVGDAMYETSALDTCGYLSNGWFGDPFSYYNSGSPNSTWIVRSPNFGQGRGGIFAASTQDGKNFSEFTFRVALVSKVDNKEKFNENIEKPVVSSNMTPIKWKGITEVPTTVDDSDWYEYRTQTSTTESGGTSKWANVKTNNGSYLVWIPRYEYKIVNGEHTSTAGTIEVKFIPVTQTEPDAGYIIHPAFQNNPSNGGWNKELSGFWVGKFESSDNGSGQVKIIPGATSWVNITVSTAFNKMQAFGIENNLTNMDSHMMKNTEWGAVAYLAHSQYGRNGTEVTINNYFISNIAKTGYAGYNISANQETSNLRTQSDIISTSGSFPYNNFYRGILASTTGNIYGIYDMSGGAYEYTMGVYNKTILSSGFSSFPEMKYYTNYTSYSSNNKGDAVYETSSSSNGYTGWFNDYSIFANATYPWFSYGGYYNSTTGAGLFSIDHYTGGGYPYISFRVVVTP